MMRALFDANIYISAICSTPLLNRHRFELWKQQLRGRAFSS